MQAARRAGHLSETRAGPETSRNQVFLMMSVAGQQQQQQQQHDVVKQIDILRKVASSGLPFVLLPGQVHLFSPPLLSLLYSSSCSAQNNLALSSGSKTAELEVEILVMSGRPAGQSVGQMMRSIFNPERLQPSSITIAIVGRLLAFRFGLVTLPGAGR